MGTIGEKDTLITIQQPVEALDQDSKPVLKFDEFAMLWSKKIVTNSFSKIGDSQQKKCDYLAAKISGITPQMIVIDENEKYQVMAILELNDEVIIQTVECTLNSSILVQSQNTVRNQFNEKQCNWAVFARMEADLIQNSGEVKLKSGVDKNYKKFTFLVRHYPRIDEKMRIVFRNKIYKIENVDIDTNPNFQRINCEESMEKCNGV